MINLRDRRTGRWSVLPLALILLLACGMPLPAQDEENSQIVTELALFEKIPVVYTPGKKRQAIREAPASTHILTHEDIEMYGGITLYDALRQVPGVYVMAVTVAQPAVTIRGLNEHTANSTLLLVDGRNVYLPLQGLFFWETVPIQMEETKQIEVVKGPVASLYGANAFNGLINIVTKSPEEINGTIVSGKFGSENTYIGSLVHGQRLERFGYKVSFGWRQFEYFDNDDYETDLGKFNAEIEYYLGDDSKLSISGGSVNGKFPFIMASVGLTPGDYDGSTGYAKVAYNREDFEAKLFWNFVNTDYTPPVTYIGGRINSYELEVKQQIDRWDKHSVTVGGGGRYDVANGTIYPAGTDEEDLSMWNIYLQDDIEVTDAFRMIASARLDSHSRADSNVSGRLAGIYDLNENHLLRASVGNSFRTPTFTEYFMEITFVTPLLSIIGRGNKDLDVETVVTGEVGYQGMFLEKRITAGVDVFWSKMDDLLDNSALTMISFLPPIAETSWENIGEVETWGIELYTEIRFNEWLSGTANYSYQEADFQDGAYERLRPEHKINVGIKAKPNEKLTAVLYCHYVDEVKEWEEVDGEPGEVDDYTLLNARVSYQLNEHARMALGASNLLNKEHQESPIGEDIGMRILGEIIVEF